MRQLSFLQEPPRSARRVVNVASVPQRSPFRYPGGKTWLVPTFREWMRSLDRRPRLLVEPFCGGGIIGLTALMEGLTERVLLGEKDPEVSSVWRVLVSGDAEALARRILSYSMTEENARRDLAKQPESDVDRAFQTILRNRVQRGGILAPGASLMRRGENGRGLLSRWYPKTLAERIRSIASHRARLEFREGDAFDPIREHIHRKTTAFFLDPPYTAGGKRAGRRLYFCNQVNHADLFALSARAQGPVMLTYDDSPEVRSLARRHGFRVAEIPMKNTHHMAMLELAITKP